MLCARLIGRTAETLAAVQTDEEIGEDAGDVEGHEEEHAVVARARREQGVSAQTCAAEC